MHIYDHFFVAMILVVAPVYMHFIGIPRMKRLYAEYRPGMCAKFCWSTTALQWTITAALLLMWWFTHRGMTDLGLAAPGGGRFWIAGLIGVAALIGYEALLRAQSRTPVQRAAAIKKVQESGPFMPRASSDLKHFAVISFTAGVCEEIVYRGFLIWYASQFTGTSAIGLCLAVVLTALVFGVGHLYQGIGGAAQVAIVGLIFGGLYLLSGTLWVPMAVHAIGDWMVGMFTVRLYQDAGSLHATPSIADTISPSSESPSDDQVARASV